MRLHVLRCDEARQRIGTKPLAPPPGSRREEKDEEREGTVGPYR